MLAGCGGDSANVAPVALQDAGTATNPTDSGTADSGKVVRTIITRSIWENFDRPDNLALDGGFEFTGAMTSHWGEASENALTLGNGSECRSGFRCVHLKSKAGIYGFFVTPKEGKISVTVHARPVAQGCNFLQIGVLDSYDQQNYQEVKVLKAELAADGWCEIEGQAKALPYTGPILYMESQSGAMVVDDVAIVGATNATEATTVMSKAMDPAFGKRIRFAGELAKDRASHPKRGRGAQSAAPWTAQVQPWLR